MLVHACVDPPMLKLYLWAVDLSVLLETIFQIHGRVNAAVLKLGCHLLKVFKLCCYRVRRLKRELRLEKVCIVH